MRLVERLAWHAAQTPHAVALRSVDRTYSYAQLLSRVEAAIGELDALKARVIAVDLGNSPDWVVLDIAAMALDLCLVPLPTFFSAGQLRHALRTAGVTAVLSDHPARLRGMLGDMLATDQGHLDLTGRDAAWIQTVPAVSRAEAVPDGVHKVTFTSGTSGEPKGVMLGWSHMRSVAVSLADAVGVSAFDHHLALMPLAVLLENIAGVYAPLWAGASVSLLPLDLVGMAGSSQVDGMRMAQVLRDTAASSAIFTPQTLQALVVAVEQSHAECPALRFGAVGGAPVSPRLLQRAAGIGLNVYEGYGLSECASVVCLNTPGANRPGSVGRALPHLGLRVAADGEVVISGATALGYLGEPTGDCADWHSGDLGRLDDDGYLYLQGRRRNVFITAYGRNVAPEWVERELTLEEPIAQAAVFGEGRPFNAAVIVPMPGVQAAAVEAALRRANCNLPDYARVTRWLPAESAFTPANGLLTGTGRIRRDAVIARYGATLDSLYCEA